MVLCLHKRSFMENENKNLTLEEKYISLMSDYEVSGQIFMGTMQDDLIYLAQKGEMHAIADLLYFWGNREDENLRQRHLNLLSYYKADLIEKVKLSNIVKDVKMRYFHQPHFLSGDEYSIMEQLTSTDEERDRVSYLAAKTYLKGLREFNNSFSGAMFLRALERNAEITGTSFRTCPVAKSIKKNLLWGDENKREKLFDNLILGVKRKIVKLSKHKKDFRSQYACAYALKKDGLKRKEMISTKSFEMFLNLSSKYEGSITEPDNNFHEAQKAIKSMEDCI